MSVQNPLSLIPHALLERPHAATRYLYTGRKPGRMTCLFQRHVRHYRRPMVLLAFPDELEADREFKRREDVRIYALTYVLAGQVKVTYADEPEGRVLRQGSMFQYSGHAMEELQLEPSAGFTECSVSVDGETGRHLAELEVWKPGLRSAEVGLHASLVRAYLNIYNDILEHSLHSRSLIHGCTRLLETVYGLIEEGDVDAQFCRRACALIAGNVGPGFTMQQAARDLDMPYDAFRHRFRRLMGMAPIEYQLRRRMEQACVLLRHHSVKETAALLEYSDPFVFSRQFKKLTGVSPRAYRKDASGPGDERIS